MRLVKRFAFLLFLLLLIFIGHTLISTGFFRTIEPKFEGTILKQITLKGAEDIMISLEDSFALISSTDRAAIPSIAEKTGGLYLIDLKTNDYTLIPLTTSFDKPFAPHGISYYKKENTYQVMAINHSEGGHSIEVFELRDKQLQHLNTLKHESMIHPNDIVMLDENRFYFTNDHRYVKGLGRLAEEYLGLSISNVVYFDGQNYKVAAKGIGYANGINYDRKRDLVYVASVRQFLVKVYSKKEDGSLTFIENIPCGTGPDNIELDKDGNLWIGAHPNLLLFNAYAQGSKEIAPSEIIKITYPETGNYSVEKIYVEKGDVMSGSSVAAVFNDLIFAGNVMDDEFLILKRN